MVPNSIQVHYNQTMTLLQNFQNAAIKLDINENNETLITEVKITADSNLNRSCFIKMYMK